MRFDFPWLQLMSNWAVIFMVFAIIFAVQGFGFQPPLATAPIYQMLVWICLGVAGFLLLLGLYRRTRRPYD